MYKKIVLLTFSSLCFLLFIEDLVRTIEIEPPITKHSFYLGNDKYLTFKPLPNSNHTFRSPSNEFDMEISYNSMGLRDIEHNLKKPINTYRILGIGDSFTMGFGAKFEDTFLYKLENMLNIHYNDYFDVEIIKSGFERYYTELERIFLQYYGIKYYPDLIIIGFVPNDIHDTFMGKESVTVKAGGYLLTRESNEIGNFGSWLYINLHSIRIVLAKYIKYKINSNYNFQWSEVYKVNGLYENEWQEVEKEILNIQSISSSINSDLILLHIPHLGPFYEGNDWYLSYPGNRLSEFSNKNGINFLDLYPTLYKESRENTLFWPIDSHPNSAGYKIIADELYNYITSNNLIVH